MDPIAITRCQKRFSDDGYISVSGGARVHYELYTPGNSSSSSSGHQRSSSSGSSSALLMVMGAFATKVHFADMARYIADTSGLPVAIYDHRGVGRSSPPKLEPQTAAQLAADAVVVADTLWGASTPIHVFG